MGRSSILKKFLLNTRGNKVRQNIFLAMASVVVFATTYMLILPAVTESGTAYCGIEEHVHTEECYASSENRVLTCTLEESDAHTHTDACYTEAQVLTCALEESEGHTHSDSCYEIVESTETVLICDQTEGEDHTHSSDCYETETTTTKKLVCGKEERAGHAHTDDCYTTEKTLICGKEESSGHTHSDDCYTTETASTEERELICGMEEHTHDTACYSNPNADLESESTWEKSVSGVALTGDWSKDVLAIADSQLGYEESTKNYIVDENGDKKGYTRYGAWYGDPYGDWCAMFVSFCINYADIPRSAMPIEASCQSWIEKLSSSAYGYYHKAGTYTPQPGDLIFFNWDSEADADHVGLVYSLSYNSEGEISSIQTIEGNAGNTVKTKNYSPNDGDIMGYAAMPVNPDMSVEETSEAAETETLIETEEESESIVETETATESEEASSEDITEAGGEETEQAAVAPRRANALTDDNSEEAEVQTEAEEPRTAEETAAADESTSAEETTEAHETYAVAEPTYADVEEEEELETAEEDVYLAAPMSEDEPAVTADSTDLYDLENYITSITIQRHADGETYWQDLTDNNVKVGDALRFNIEYELPSGTLSSEHKTITYQVPSSFTIIEGDSGIVYDNDGAAVGTYTIETSGSISITFYDEYVTKNASGSRINGRIAFTSSVSALNGDAGEDIKIPFKDEITLHVKGNYGDIEVKKSAENVATIDGTLDYRIVVSSEGGTGDAVILTDTMTDVLPVIPDGSSLADVLCVTDQDDHTITVASDMVTYDASAGSFVLTLPALSESGSYTVTYPAKLTESVPSGYGKTIFADNKVTAESTDSIGTTITDEDEVKTPFTKYIVSKSGSLSDGTITWTIKINNNATGSKIDISGWTLSDNLNGEAFTGTVTISPNPETGKDSATVSLPYTFPDTAGETAYTVTYTTSGDESTTNEAVMTPPTGSDVTTGKIGVGTYSLSKTTANGLATDMEAVETSDDSLVYNANWKVTVDTTQGAIPTNKTGTLYGRTGFTYWYLQDLVGNTTSSDQNSDYSYFTKEQIEDYVTFISAAIDATGYSGGYYIFATQNIDSGSPILVGKGGTADDYWDSTYSGSLSDGVKRNRIVVYFDSELPAGQVMSYEYASTVVISDASASQSFLNTIQIASNKTLASHGYDYYNPTMKKTDARGGDSEYTIDSDELKYTYSNTSFENVLRWNINFYLPAMEYTEDVIITESLPEGVELLDMTSNQAYMYGMSTHLGDSTGGSYHGLRNIYDGSLVRFNTSDTVCTNKGFTFNDTQSVETRDGYSITYKKISETVYQIIIPKELANAGAGGAGLVEVFAHIKDGYTWDGITHSFINHASMTTGTTTLGNVSNTQKVKANVVSKSSTGFDADTRIVPYTVTINPNANDLAAGKDTLEVTDILYFATDGNTVNAALDYSSVRVTDANTGADVTDQCTYRTEETSEGGYAEYTIYFTIPDSRKLTIEYAYKLTGNGNINVVNGVVVEGITSGGGSTEYSMDIAVQDSSASAVLVGVNVYKVDSQNYSIHLEGAEFTLQGWNGSEWVDIQTYTTAAETGSFNTGALTDNKAYRLLETKPPAGYTIKQTTAYEFYIRNTAADAAAECKPSEFSGKALNNGDGITITNDLIAYELPETGGLGTTPYTMGGLFMMAGALVAYIFVARRRRERRFR